MQLVQTKHVVLYFAPKRLPCTRLLLGPVTHPASVVDSVGSRRLYVWVLHHNHSIVVFAHLDRQLLSHLYHTLEVAPQMLSVVMHCCLDVWV